MIGSSFELLHEGGEDDILPPRLEFLRCDTWHLGPMATDESRAAAACDEV